MMRQLPRSQERNIVINYSALRFTAILLMASASPAFAAREKKLPAIPPAFSITPTLGGYLFAGSTNLDAAPLYGVRVAYDITGKNIADSLGIEGSLNYFSTKSSDAQSATGYLYRLDAIYPFNPRNKLVTFIAVGVGGMSTTSGSQSDSSPLLNYGLGMKYFFKDYLGVRADFRHLIVYDNISTRSDFELSAGVTYVFGKERKKVVPPPVAISKSPAMPSLDEITKGMKTPDAAPKPLLPEAPKTVPPETPEPVQPGTPELLSRTPKPLSVLETLGAAGAAAVGIFIPGVSPLQSQLQAGRAPVGPAAEKSRQPESPATPVAPQQGETKAALPAAPAALPAAPAALPGAPAAIAQPPAAVRGGTVKESAPVPVPKSLTVYFKVNSAAVEPRYYSELKVLAQILKGSPGASATIEGHTDSTGRLSINDPLSQRRAQSVKRALVKFGASARTVTVKGYAASVPVADNLTREGKQQNRRATAIVTLKTRR